MLKNIYTLLQEIHKQINHEVFITISLHLGGLLLRCDFRCTKDKESYSFSTLINPIELNDSLDEYRIHLFIDQVNEMIKEAYES